MYKRNRYSAEITYAHQNRVAANPPPKPAEVTWPFPGSSGPTPWTPAQEREYQQNNKPQWPDAPF